jgi:GDP-4-dehydro-6-deoxy-D-mannose reductase
LTRPRPTIVTGATGFAGRHLLDRLGPGVVAWHRPSGRPPDRSRAAVWQPVDLLDRDAVSAAITHTLPANIFHLAGAPNVAASWESAASHLHVNALGTVHLLEAVRRHAPGCRVLVVSSGQIYRASDQPIAEGDPLEPSNPYGLSKLAQDELARRLAGADGLDVVIARPFNHIGPLQEPGFAVSSFARQIARIERGLEAPVLRVGNLDARRDVTDVRDVVEAYDRLMDDGETGRVYNVCSGVVWRIRDLLDHLLRLSAASIQVEPDPDRFRPTDVPCVRGNASRIRAELGWVPSIPIEQTLRDTLAWWRSH